MGEPDPRQDGDEQAEAAYQALVTLHALSPDYGVDPDDLDDLPLPYRRADIGVALRLVGAASPEQIPVSARLAVLYDLARAGYPERADHDDAYRGLAESIVQQRELQDEPMAADDLLRDIAGAAEAGEPLATQADAHAFTHREIAFIGQRVCTIRRVLVGGIGATWIYSQFETDAPFEDVADWVDPRRWPTWGPMFFKRMEPIGALLTLAAPPPGDPHWHGVFHEEVQLVRRLNTLLRCAYWRNGARTAAMTYDLNLSLDREIDVDRGYVLVNDTGPVRTVQALKIVSFTTNVWDDVAEWVCPFWTEWIRGAVRSGTTSSPTTPSQTPGIGPSPLGRSVEAWIEYFGKAVQPYLDLCTGASSRMRSGSYTSADLFSDGTQWWSRFAKDWAQAWSNWSETVDEVAKEGLDAALTPPGAPREQGRGTVSALATPAAVQPGGSVLAVAGLGANDDLECSDFVSIDQGAARIPAADVVLTVETAEEGTGRVRLRAMNAAAPPGLYVGRLSTPANPALTAVQLYVSQATGI